MEAGQDPAVLRKPGVDLSAMEGNNGVIGLDVSGCSVVLVACFNEPGEDDQLVSWFGVSEEGWPVWEELQDGSLDAGLGSVRVVGCAGHGEAGEDLSLGLRGVREGVLEALSEVRVVNGGTFVIFPVGSDNEAARSGSWFPRSLGLGGNVGGSWRAFELQGFERVIIRHCSGLLRRSGGRRARDVS